MTPSDALERQVEALLSIQASRRDGKLQREASPGEVRQWATDEACLQRAQPYCWSAQTTALVMNVGQDFDLATVPVTRHLVPDDCCWHYFADGPAFTVSPPDGPQGKPLWAGAASVRAVSTYCFWADNHPYLGMTAWAPLRTTTITDREVMHTDGALVPILWASVDVNAPLGSTIAQERLNFQGFFDGETRLEIEKMKRFVVAASTFLRQRLLVLDEVAAERHARKRVAKTMEPRLIRVVQLRRTEHLGTSSSAGETREWNWQWTVRGHVRQQYYASLGEHLPVWINPYFKGPGDKPMKPRSTPIFAVER